MSVAFGFSAGDFIAALGLVTTVVSALRESGGSSSEYRALVTQLYTLETALLRVKRLELDDSKHAEAVALRQAAAQCQRTIDGFWEKIQKYQPSLRAEGSGSRAKDAWRKVKWAVCKNEDLARFKADLMGHTESIELLLTMVQIAEIRLGTKKNDESNQVLASRIQDSYFGCMRRIGVMIDYVSTCAQQGKQLLDMTAKVVQTNIQIFQIVLNIQDIITRIPKQIERQQPVYFVDALGRQTPFHLEFITCAEIKLKDIGPGAAKIEKGEFVIQDSIAKIDVDLNLPWEACFHPGQHVAMSMVFDSTKASRLCTAHCPRCQKHIGNDFAEDEDIECARCKMVYRQSKLRTYYTRSQLLTTRDHGAGDHTSGPKVTCGSLKRKVPYDDDWDMALFRRVRIRTLARNLMPPVMYVRALHDYESDYRSVLSFHEGDVIEVITSLKSGWWDGVINGVRGWFPSNYCELVESVEEENVGDTEDEAKGHGNGSKDVDSGQIV